MQQDDTRGSQRVGGAAHVVRRQARVRSRRGKNLFLAVATDLAERDASERGRIAHHGIDGDTFGDERLDDRIAADVVSNARDERRGGAEAGGAHRLIRPLAPGRLLEQLAVDGLSGLGKPR